MRLVDQVIEALFDFNRLIFIFQRLVQIRFGGEEISRSVVPSFPVILIESTYLPLNAGVDNVVDIHRNLERNRDFVPAQSDHGGVRFDVVKVISQRIVELGSVRLYRNAQRIFILLVTEATPCSGHLREDHRPIIFAGNHVQSIGSFVERLAFNRDRIGECDGGIFVGPGTPDLSVRHQLAPNLAAVDEWPMVVDGDVGNADALRDNGMLTLPGEIKHQGLRVAKTTTDKNPESTISRR